MDLWLGFTSRRASLGLAMLHFMLEKMRLLLSGRVMKLAIWFSYFFIAPVSAKTIFIKTNHQTIAHNKINYLRLKAEKTLRAAVRGPVTIKVTVLRWSRTHAPLDVDILYDGQKSYSFITEGTSSQNWDLRPSAGRSLFKTVTVPKGIHTLFVRTGPGEGGILVLLEEQRKKSPLLITNNKQQLLRKPSPDTNKSTSESSTAPSVAQVPRHILPPPSPSLSAPAASNPTIDANSMAKATLSAAHQPESTVLSQKEEDETSKSSDYQLSNGPRFFFGAQAGMAYQTQVGAWGLQAAISAQWVAIPILGRENLAIGISANMMHYGLGFSVKHTKGLSSFLFSTNISSAFFITDLIWKLRPLAGHFTPRIAMGGGVCLGWSNTVIANQPSSQFFVLPAMSFRLGTEIPWGRHRIGLDFGYLWAQTNHNEALGNLELGGSMILASWQFGL